MLIINKEARIKVCVSFVLQLTLSSTSSFQMVGMVIGAGIAIVLIAILIFFILRRIQLRSQ